MKPQNTKDWYQSGELRAQAWNDRVPPPRNPTLLALQDGRQPKNAATGTTLFPQSPMPCGKFAGRYIMERVPRQYLLEAHEQFHRHPQVLPGLRASWAEVADYVERFLLEHPTSNAQQPTSNEP